MRFNKIKTVVLAFSAGLFLTQCENDFIINDPTITIEDPVINVDDPNSENTLNIPPPIRTNSDPALVAQGRDVFRTGTFGDEAFWSGALQLDKAILGEANGGFGPGLSPSLALSLGVKVDATALPQTVVDAIVAGEIDLDDPATTVALLSLNAVIGVQGTFNDNGELTAVGISCALCHSTVDDSFAPGIGNRLDGWPNRDIDVGTIIASANTQPFAELLGVDIATVNTVLTNWGRGRFDGALLLDGQPVAEDGSLIPAAVIPSIFGLSGVNPVSYTGFGNFEDWARFVAVIELGGQGNFVDERLNDPRFPIAVQTSAFNRSVAEDLVDPVLPALQAYILSLDPPVPNANSFEEAAAIRGQNLFNGKAQCASCHSGALFADNILRTPEEIGIDAVEANRFPSGMYRTPPLRALFTKATEGYFHDGRFADLTEVIDHYDNHFDLQLTTEEKSDLEEYLNAL
ncbi:hypothetical protein [Spongiimicrobium salis]|uniref:hypothetical protein n=1 Tax=Spongiimicrobium salis TaxID=1667022 RepID=UPI00374CD161